MTSNGYIKLHRKLLSWEWYKDPNTRAVFLHLLLIANYGESRFKGIELHPGQAVIGRKALAKSLGLTERQVRTALKHLKTTNEIAIKTTNKFSVVTIVNWALYQSDDTETTNKTTSNESLKRPASDHTKRKKEEKEEFKRGRPRENGQLEATYEMLEEWANE